MRPISPLICPSRRIPTNHERALTLIHRGSHRTTNPPNRPTAAVGTICQSRNIFLKYFITCGTECMVSCKSMIYGAPRARVEGVSTIVTSTRKWSSGELKGRGLACPQKCLLSRLCFRWKMIFPAEVGLIWGDEEPGVLWIVRVRRSRVFL